MNAFMKTNDGTIKVYRIGLDWRVVLSGGDERWFSVWQSDIFGSLLKCFNDVMPTFFSYGEIEILSLN